MRGSATPRPVTGLAALVLCAAGCTICPDPFDYSGPVPGGSAPQNDFEARANGIIPIGAHPVPWPPVVQAPPGPDAGTPSTVAAGGEPEAVRTDDSAAVQPVVAEGPVTTPVVDASHAAATPEVSAAPQESATPNVSTAPDVPVLEAILPPPARPRPGIEPPLRETPGWKPRG